MPLISARFRAFMGLLVWTSTLATSAAPSVASAQPQLAFEAIPASGELRPGEPETMLKIAASEDGKPAAGWLHLRLESPVKNRLFSTDFPIVEGTELLATTLPLQDGRWELRYRLPIRGVYTVNASFGPTAEAAVTAPTSQATWTFAAHEQPLKVRNLLLLLGLLLLAGGASGFALGRSRRQLDVLGAAW